MQYILGLMIGLLTVPHITLAQTSSVQGFITGILAFLDNIIIPFLLGLAFLFVVINVLRFFIIGGATSEGRENAKYLVFYSLGAFVLIFAFWGLVNLVNGGIGFDSEPCAQETTSDYVQLHDPILAPCTSIRPQPRPVNLVPTTTPATPVPPPTTPVTPVTPTPATPVTPTTTIAVTEEAAEMALALFINTVKAGPLSMAGQEYFGSQVGNEMKRVMVADLNTALTAKNYEQAVEELWRLADANLITIAAATDATTLLDRYNSFIIPRPTTPTAAEFYGRVSDHGMMPGSINTLRTSTSNALHSEFSRYENSSISNFDSDEFLNSLYDTTVAPATRLAHFDATVAGYITTNFGSPTNLARIATLRTQLVHDYNAEIYYNGGNNADFLD